MNRLFYGDNLAVLREHIADASVDLAYLDPPFNSNANYSMTQESGPVEAFTDKWRWDEAAFDEATRAASPRASELLRALRAFLGDKSMTAYLAMMLPRLVELHRALKPTGSFYLQCDPTASHYLKLLLDAVFGAANYRSEIIWKRTGAHNDSKTWGRVHDALFFYTKGKQFIWNTPRIAYSKEFIAAKYRTDDGDGRGLYRHDNITSPSYSPSLIYEWLGFPSPPNGWRYKRETMQRMHDNGRIYYPRLANGELDATKRPQVKRYINEMKGAGMGTIWADIPPINSQAAERLGYPTQKPLALLERIIAASSNPGDVVLDPFCGSGTTLHAAQKLGREWAGIDANLDSIALVLRRLEDHYPEQWAATALDMGGHGARYGRRRKALARLATP